MSHRCRLFAGPSAVDASVVKIHITPAYDGAMKCFLAYELEENIRVAERSPGHQHWS